MNSSAGHFLAQLSAIKASTTTGRKAVALYGQDMKPSGAIDSGQVEREPQASDDLLKMFEVASA